MKIYFNLSSLFRKQISCRIDYMNGHAHFVCARIQRRNKIITDFFSFSLNCSVHIQFFFYFEKKISNCFHMLSMKTRRHGNNEMSGIGMF
jgi:hypothetical protein